MSRTIMVGPILMLAFGLFERRPAHLPRWLARWVLQVAGVAVAVPFVVAGLCFLLFHGEPLPFWLHETRMNGFPTPSITGVMLAPRCPPMTLLTPVENAARLRTPATTVGACR